MFELAKLSELDILRKIIYLDNMYSTYVYIYTYIYTYIYIYYINIYTPHNSGMLDAPQPLMGPRLTQ